MRMKYPKWAGWVLIATLSLAGCGSSESKKPEEQAGLTIFSISALPSFSGFVNPSVIVQHGPIPILKAQTAGEPGSFCSEFCYLKQGIEEAVRQNQELDFFLCLAKRAQQSDPLFEIPGTDGCGYFEITPPNFSSDGGPDGVSLDLPSRIQARLCRNGNNVTIHTCGDGALEQEAAIQNHPATESVSASIVKRLFQSNGCEDKYRVDLNSNCTPGAFGNDECAATINGNYCGCYGSGTINVSLDGGSEPRVQYESDFAARGLGDNVFGQFNFCSHGDWSEGGQGCFASQASGNFPAIPSSEVPLAALDGCQEIVNAANVCPNPGFDPESFDPLYPQCPFEATKVSTCGFAFSNANCCGLSGETLDQLSGQDIDDAPLSSLFGEVSGRACPGQGDCAAIDFDDSWDCQAPAGQTFKTIDLLTATGIDVSECADLLTAVNTFVADENCSEQTADASVQEIEQDVATLSECQAATPCSGGQFCHIVDDQGTTATSDDVGVCVTPSDDCDLASPSCASGEVCAYDPQFSHTKCVPDFACNASCTANQPCNAATGACEDVSCNFTLGDTCAARLGPGYACNFTAQRCETTN